MNVLRRLVARPGIAVPNPAGSERIVIAGNDVDRARNCLALKEREGALGYCLGNAVIVEHISGDEDEVDLMRGGLARSCSTASNRASTMRLHALSSNLVIRRPR